jgi:hypothetical protein
MELKLINDDTQLLATSQEHEEHFMLMVVGVAVQARMA